jgi:DNA-binding NtrC family response regulator
MSHPESKIKILIIDDEKPITLLLSAILKNNYLLEIAHNSHDAIPKTHEFQPDLITLDINMPGLKGDDLLPIIRAWKPHVPVLVISGSKDAGIHEKCIERGAIGFITKPFERNQLLEQIELALDGEVQPPQISESTLDEVELALGILERQGLISEDQAKEEIDKVKSKLKS